MIRGRDDRAFAVAMVATASALGAELSEGKIETYWEALKDLPIEVVSAGLREARRSLRFFPKPVEVRELAVGVDEDRAAVAWASAFKLAIIEMLGGWRRIWALGRHETPDIEIQNVKREFIRFYVLVIRRTDLIEEAPAILVDAEEQRRGLVFGPVLKARIPAALGSRMSTPPALPAAERPEDDQL